jgi:hypothetical protein
MGFHKLEGFHQAEGLFHTSAHWEVIDTQMLDDSIGVNYEEASASKFSLISMSTALEPRVSHLFMSLIFLLTKHLLN